jgi:NADH-quinone oxidoreductase subunit E
MDTAILDKILAKWDCNPDHLIMIAQDMQDEFRHLPKEAMQYVADQLAVPYGRIYHVGTFFKAFSLEPKGNTIVQVCMGTACVVKGSEKLLAALKRELKIADGQTTPDRKYTLEGVRCLGCCSLAPVVTFNAELYGNVKVAEIPKLLKKHANGGQKHE